MQSKSTIRHRSQDLLPILFGLAVVAALLSGAQTAAATSGPTVTGQVCMQTTFSGHTAEPVPNSDRLNCTAEDIKIAHATSVDPASCIEGSTFNLTATFLVDVTASSRYDAGFYFNIDGGASARLGTCSLSVLTAGLSPSLQLDNDFCGDLNSGQVAVTFYIPNVVCQAAPGTNQLRLPNCTAWHSNSGTPCTTNTEADPDTKSKCKCDDNFTVPVIVETATLAVTKTASPTSVPETGGLVTFSVTVTNEAAYVSTEIDTLTDDVYGNIADPANPNVSNNSCPSLVGDVLAPGQSANCSFQANVSGDYNQTVTDVVDVCATQINTGASVCDDDDASVTITDVASAPTLTKTAQSASCTVDATYQVVVHNTSAIDTLTINALNDDKFGNITVAHAASEGVEQVVSTTCALPTQPIAVSSSFSCSFVGRIVSSNCNFTHADVVTGSLTDDDGVSSQPSDGASVSVGTTFP